MRNGFCEFVQNGLFLPLSLAFALIAMTACTEIHTKDNIAGGSSDDAGIVAIKNKDVAGVSQKGPFVSGSTVTVQELDGVTLKQTGKSFKGTIKSDKGDFVINNVSLASQYAIVEVTGYYRKEIGGLMLPEKSSGMITLRALTDLSKRNTVNINLLTHLEFDRVMYLVGTGLSLHDAKNQAETEIFNAFKIHGEFASPEDLDIFREGDGNAALLAISILMHRGVSDAEFTESLAKFAADIEIDGKWDDESSKMGIATWAKLYDGSLRSIRQNIEEWNLGPVPDFEKYVRNFWYEIYGLGGCGEEENGVISTVKEQVARDYDFVSVAPDGSIVGYRTVYYICQDGAWRLATDIEKDFYQSGKDENAEDGEIWKGLVTGRYYQYDEVLNRWIDPYFTVATGVRINSNDEVLAIMGSGCTTKREGEVDTGSDGKKYVCENLKWKLAPVHEFLPKESCLNPNIKYDSMTDERDGKVYRTVKIGEQTWMAENLNYAYLVPTAELDSSSFCYRDSLEYCEDYGRLYLWSAAMDSAGAIPGNDANNCGSHFGCAAAASVRGVCPEGWHLPTKEEWDILISIVGDYAGRMLKSSGICNPRDDGTDEYGFGGLFAGRWSGYSESYINVRANTFFWSSTEIYHEAIGFYEDAYSLTLDYYPSAQVEYDDKRDAGSVRCLKD